MLAPLLLFVVFLLGGGIYSLSQLSGATRLVVHTDQVRLGLSALLSTVIDAETGARGYVLTGDPQFLEPFDQAQANWRARLARARELTADNPDQQQRLARLEQLSEERLAMLAKMRLDYDAGQRGAQLAPGMRDAKSKMDELRALVGDLQREEELLDGIRQGEVTHRWHVTLWLFAGGSLAFLLVVLVGWKLRTNAEEKRRAAEERFRFMVDSVKDYAIITLDRDGRVTSWNRGAEAIKGWRADEIIGQHFSKFYPAEDIRAGKVDRELEIVLRDGRFEEEGWRVRKDGSRFWANVILTAVKDERGQLVGFTKVTRDLSERQAAEVALADEYQRRTDAERETRFAQMFIGILGHDLRNPLNAILMATRVLKKKIGRPDPAVLDRISSSAQRMSNMVDQLLDLTRSRLAGGIPVEKKPADLSQIVSGVVEELRLANPEREIRWTPHDGEHRCAWDPDRMEQVVSNLIGNAIQHSEPSTPVTIELDGQPDEIRFWVHNDGAPISPELLPNIFEPYRRNTARSQRSRGLGLGLFIAQQVVRAHGGHIEVRSTAEEGTIFTVTLPCESPTKVASHPGIEYPRR